jgi:ATP-dependent RNA helicase DeaD
MKKFEKLGIMEPVLKAIEELGYTEPTEIQEKSIPIILEGRDVIAGSATGSGKTFAFSTAVIQNCEKGKGVQSIILTPTRELAEQVKESMRDFAKYKRLNMLAVYGGVSINPQIEKLRRTDVVIGTPGRVLDHMSRGTLKLNKVKVVVLDEADRMLDMGFIDDVERILSQCSKDRQTLLYSATIHGRLKKIAQNHMNNPETIKVESYVDPKKLRQAFYSVARNMKFSLLVHLLKENQVTGLTMVFCNTQHMTDTVAKNLNKNGFDAVSIHGGLTQNRRTKTLEMFNSGKAFILVCTDVAARGLHIENVSHVYNYDIPKEPKQYVHRIGRTARAGEKGIAINLLSPMDYDNFNRVLDLIDVEVEQLELPHVQKVMVQSNRSDRSNKFYKGGDMKRYNKPRRQRY